MGRGTYIALQVSLLCNVGPSVILLKRAVNSGLGYLGYDDVTFEKLQRSRANNSAVFAYFTAL